MTVAVEEVRFDLDGFTLAGRRWRTGSGRRPVLALHGWLDNAASFDRLAPLLPDADLLAIDLPGHGLSDHRGVRGTYNIWDDLPELVRLLDRLGWTRCHLLGHSRGAVIASLFAATLPERVASAVFLDSVWPMAPGTTLFEQLAAFVRDYAQEAPPATRYPSPERALAVRCKIGAISEEAARPIVERGLQPVEGGWQWRADPRLRYASAFKLDADHSRQLLERLQGIPTLALFAEEGLGQRVASAALAPLLLSMLEHRVLPGSHHFHLEAQAPALAAAISAAWERADATCHTDEESE